MPQVPKLDLSVTQQSGGPGAFFSGAGATPEAFGAGVGAAQQGLGRQIEHVGDVIQKHTNLMQDRANEAAANDMFVQWDVEAAKVGVWYRSLQGKQAVDANPEYVRKIEEARQKFLETAPNGEVARMFDRDAKRRMGYMITDSAYYAGNQNKAYNVGAARARQSLAIQQAGNSANETEFQDNMKIAMDKAEVEGNELGWSPEAIQAHKSVAASKAWETRLATIAMRDPFAARDMYERNKDKILDPVTRMHIEKNLHNQYNSIGTRTDAHSIESGTPFVGFPGDRKTYRGAISTIESGSAAGNYSTIGPETGKGRAYGRYQVMDFNVGPWTEEVLGKRMSPQEFLKDKEAQDAVFDAKFGALVKKYGNPQDAASAWFSGRPLSQATAAGARDVNIGVGEYVKRFNAALGKDYAEPLTTESGPEWLGKAMDRAKGIAQARAPDNPQYEDMLVSRVKTAYSNVKTIKNAVDQQNFMDVQQALIEQDEFGKPRITSPSQVMDNPALNDAYNKLPPTKQRQVLSQIERNAKADVPLTAERWTRFQELRGLAVTNPTKFAEVEVGAEDLPRTLSGQLLNQQRAMMKKLGDTSQLTRAISTVTPMLNDAGIVRSRTDQQKAAVYNQFVGAYQTELESWQKEKTQFPNEKEQMQIAAKLLRETNPDRWFFQSAQRGFEIPDTNKDEISKEFTKRFGRPPSPAEVYTVFQRQRARESNAAR